MTDERGGDDTPSLDGTPVDDAVEMVADGSHDPEAVREALENVAEDGVVTRAAAEDAVAHLSKVVATPETRIEVAAGALEDAREAAAPFEDIDTVRARLDTFEERLDAVERRAAALGPELQGLLDRVEDGGLHDVGAGVQQLTEEANAVQRAADDLMADAESFERWVGNPEARYEELDGELDAIQGSLAELSEALDDVERSRGDEHDEDGGSKPSLSWSDAALQCRVLELLVADVRAELADLRTMADRAGVGGPPEALAARLDDLEARTGAVDDRLDAVSRPRWRERFDDLLASFDGELAALDPPVDWGTVQATLEEYRAALRDEGEG